jgi:Zn-dependent protease
LLFSLFVSWETSLVLIALISIHEHGRLFKAHRRGLEAHGVASIPFIGAWAIFDGYVFKRKDDFDIAMGGLTFSTIPVFFFFLFFSLTGEAYFAEMVKAMIALNCVFLIPIGGFDGGRITKALSYSINRKVGIFCLVLSVACAVYLTKLHFFLFFLIFISLWDLSNKTIFPTDKRSMSFTQWIWGFLRLSCVIGLLTYIYLQVELYEGSGALKSPITGKDLLVDR